MFITVTCPKCGRGIKVKKRYALSTGGIPCLKCKVRIPITKEQVDAYIPADAAPEPAAEGIPEAAPATGDPAPAETAAEEEAPAIPPADEAVAEPIPVPEPEPEPPPAPEPVPEPEPALSLPDTDDTDAITPVLASSPEPEAPPPEPAHTPVGAQITFTCPNCQSTYTMRQSLAGKKIRCKNCARIVKVAADSPVVPSAEPPPPPPPPPPEDDDIPVIFSPAEPPDPALAAVFSRPTPPSPPPSAPVPEPEPEPSADGETVARLRKALAAAEERANSAEEMLQQMTREKTNTEMASFRKVRDLEAQLRELGKPGAGTLSRSDVESLLKTLCEALDANLKQEISAHQNLVDDLKRQLTQALH